jgi:hypothetical protein
MTVALIVAAPAATIPFLKNDRRLAPRETLVTLFMALLLDTRLW